MLVSSSEIITHTMEMVLCKTVKNELLWSWHPITGCYSTCWFSSFKMHQEHKSLPQLPLLHQSWGPFWQFFDTFSGWPLFLLVWAIPGKVIEAHARCQSGSSKHCTANLAGIAATSAYWRLSSTAVAIVEGSNSQVESRLHCVFPTETILWTGVPNAVVEGLVVLGWILKQLLSVRRM